MISDISSVPTMQIAKRSVVEEKLWDAAQTLEAQFLATMLAEAKLGETPSAFGGGHGEEHFASFLRDEHATAMVEQGGIGLAEAIFNELKDR